MGTAAQAIPEKGLISLTSEKREDEVVVSVADNGVGMAPEQLKNIQPLLHHQTGGQGTGLGLSISYGANAAPRWLHRGRERRERAPGFRFTFKDAPASAEAAFTGLDSAIG